MRTITSTTLKGDWLDGAGDEPVVVLRYGNVKALLIPLPEDLPKLPSQRRIKQEAKFILDEWKEE